MPDERARPRLQGARSSSASAARHSSSSTRRGMGSMAAMNVVTPRRHNPDARDVGPGHAVQGLALAALGPQLAARGRAAGIVADPSENVHPDAQARQSDGDVALGAGQVGWKRAPPPPAGSPPRGKTPPSVAEHHGVDILDAPPQPVPSARPGRTGAAPPVCAHDRSVPAWRHAAGEWGSATKPIPAVRARHFAQRGGHAA